MVELTRRRILVNGTLVLFPALLLSVPFADRAPDAHGWLAVHIVALLACAMTLLTGLSWRDLDLPPAAARALHWMAVVNGYVGLALVVIASVVRVPRPFAMGIEPTPAQMDVLAPFLAWLAIGATAWAALFVIGLRAEPTASEI